MKKRFLHLIILSLVALLSTTVIIAGPVMAGDGGPLPDTDWIVWEMEHPAQSLLQDGTTLWVGSHNGGLYQWHTETGYQNHYTTTHGLSGDDIVSLALDDNGRLYVAAFDGGVSRSQSSGPPPLAIIAAGAGGGGDPDPGDLPFEDITPFDVEHPWDLAVDPNGLIWLGTLGSGVMVYDGFWYNQFDTSTSDIPFDDVYAVAAEGDNLWVGTIGYGLARWNWNDYEWEQFSLPVDIAHPTQAGTRIDNNAINDIAVDFNGNKWLATDGAGVVKLDAANSTWTVYNTGNSALSDDFVYRVTGSNINFDDVWFGTLGGGAVHRDAGGNLDTLDTTNSPLSEDDILDVIANDGNSPLWFAAFDTGLVYYGDLPATPPTFPLEPRYAPEYTPGTIKSYYLWLDPDTYLWHLTWSGDGDNHTFNGEIVADAPLGSVTTADLEANDTVTVQGGTLTIAAEEQTGQDEVIFAVGRQATQLTIKLKIDGAYRPFNINVGQAGEQPNTAPFRLTPPQPIPPAVTVEGTQNFEEGASVFLSGLLTDADSPLDHDIRWAMGDGTIITDTLVPAHSYADNGAFTPTLTITDVHGEVGSHSLPLTITNVAPEVDFYHEPERPEPGQVITFFGTVFDPGEADTHTYVWDFGDSLTATASLTVTHSYAVTGTYDVTLTVVDDDGGVGVISYPLTIGPFGADFTGYPGVGLPPFTATLYDTSTGAVTSRTWDFGDGSPPVITDAVTVDHRYDNPGIYDVSLTVTGPSGSDTVVRPGYIVAVTPATGTMIIEAEDYARQLFGPGPSWVTRTVQLGYSGDSYVEAVPDIDEEFDPADATVSAELQYDLGMTLTGTYTVWLRGYAPNATGDSVYVGLNSQPITTTDYISEYPPGQWAWDHRFAESSQPVTVTIDYPGVHTLNLWVREDGFAIDQIIVTNNPGFSP